MAFLIDAGSQWRHVCVGKGWPPLATISTYGRCQWPAP